jgi:hypothetical protein
MLQGMCGSFPAIALGIVANFRPGRMAPSGGTSSFGALAAGLRGAVWVHFLSAARRATRYNSCNTEEKESRREYQDTRRLQG